jgi:hypothetical protein
MIVADLHVHWFATHQLTKVTTFFIGIDVDCADDLDVGAAGR